MVNVNLGEFQSNQAQPWPKGEEGNREGSCPSLVIYILKLKTSQILFNQLHNLGKFLLIYGKMQVYYLHRYKKLTYVAQKKSLFVRWRMATSSARNFKRVSHQANHCVCEVREVFFIKYKHNYKHFFSMMKYLLSLLFKIDIKKKNQLLNINIHDNISPCSSHYFNELTLT